MEFELQGEHIELVKLLKAIGIAENGGHAKAIVNSDAVYFKGEVENRKRLKLKKGDQIEIDGSLIKII